MGSAMGSRSGGPHGIISARLEIEPFPVFFRQKGRLAAGTRFGPASLNAHRAGAFLWRTLRHGAILGQCVNWLVVSGRIDLRLRAPSVAPSRAIGRGSLANATRGAAPKIRTWPA
jgi:hypothetical protein